jgi:glyoxylase-like metal-dependent hydrolase (beta-lactamase superfamily II)
MKWSIGDIEVYQIVELEAGVGTIIQSIIKNATRENIQRIDWLSPNFADKAGNLKALVQSFLVKSKNKNILIDTCNGNDKTRIDIPAWANLKTNFLSRLSEAGATVEDIDTVACTHIHNDHVGWNTRLEGGNWVPTFPNAKYVFSQEEYEYWEEKPEKMVADDKAAFDDSVAPIVEAGMAEFVQADYNIDQHVSLIPAPGHTPGHVAVLLESQGQRGIISGDFIHHPCQIASPQWATEADTQPDTGVVTRKRILDQIASCGTLLIGSHFANPVAGLVERLGDSFVLKLL